jgi:peptidoglycan/xylan/chitin deacetylase (PgdA/CDA1 family)
MSRTGQLAKLLTTTRLDRLAKLSWRGLLVLNYHRFGRASEADDPDLYSCTPEEFEQHVKLLSDRFEIVPAGSTDWQHGSPARRIAITVDDGYADQLQAAEIMKAHGVPGTFFITTGFLDDPVHAWWDEIAWMCAKPVDLPASRWLPEGLKASGRSQVQYRKAVNATYKAKVGDDKEEFLDALAGWTHRPRLAEAHPENSWMSWDDVRKLPGLGMEVGAHSVTHPILANLDDERQGEEIRGSVKRLRKELTTPVDTFSYPVGARTSFNQATRALMDEVGMRRAYSFYDGFNPRGGATDRYDILRTGVFTGHTPEIVAAMAAIPGVLCKPASA